MSVPRGRTSRSIPHYSCYTALKVTDVPLNLSSAATNRILFNKMQVAGDGDMVQKKRLPPAVAYGQKRSSDFKTALHGLVVTLLQ